MSDVDDVSPDELAVLSDEQVWQRYMADRLSLHHDWEPLLAADAPRIRAILVQIINDVSHQLAVRRSELDAFHAECLDDEIEGRQRFFDARRDHDEWRAGAMQFKRHVEARAALVKRYVDQQRRANHEKQVRTKEQHYRETIRQLTLAIARHNRNCAESGLQGTRADMRLWGLLDELTVPHGISDATLSEMVSVWGDDE
jgi:hypothetical protein